MAELPKPDVLTDRGHFWNTVFALLLEGVFVGGLKSLWKAVTSTVTDKFVGEPAKRKLQGEDEHKTGDKHTFAEALTQLALENPEAARKIREFMRPPNLNTLDERNDFMNNAAKVGQGVAETKNFLLVLGGLETHNDRKNLVQDLSFIGEGEQNFLESNQKSLRDLNEFFKGSTLKAQKKLEEFKSSDAPVPGKTGRWNKFLDIVLAR